MKKLLLAAAVLAALFVGLNRQSVLPPLGNTPVPGMPAVPADTARPAHAAFAERDSGQQVHGEGTVVRLLPDDDEGSRHQRFIIAMASGQTLLVAHNIDLAPRLDSLKAGDVIEFNGVYEWNGKGGVIHWTHRDPRGRHPAGWLKFAGRTFQ